MSWIRKAGAAGIVWGAVLLGASTAPADKPANTVVACLKDTKRLCKDVKPGAGRVLECLAQKKNQLSAACKPAVVPHAPVILDWRKVCGADADKLCTNTPAGPALTRCLSRQKKKLSNDCRAKLNDAQGAALVACVHDSAKLCKDVKPGGGRVLGCLAENEKKLTPACAGAIRPVKASISGWRSSCGADIDKHCPKTVPGWHTAACLKKNEAKLSKSCVDHAKRAATVYAALCAADVKQHCKGVQEGEGRIYSCLQSHYTELKPRCAVVIAPKIAK